MQLLIVLLLVLIVFILAPWMIWVAAAGVAAWGLWLLIGGGVILIATVIGLTWASLSGRLSDSKAKSSMDRKIAEANEIIRAKEAAKASGAESVERSESSALKVKAKPSIDCAHCGREMPKFEMFCPACGKDRKAAG